MKAGELGCNDAYHKLGYAYSTGSGVEKDLNKAAEYWEIAAMAGNQDSRYNLGI